MIKPIYPSIPRLNPEGTGYICDQCGKAWQAGDDPHCVPCTAAWELIEARRAIYTSEKVEKQKYAINWLAERLMEQQIVISDLVDALTHALYQLPEDCNQRVGMKAALDRAKGKKT